MSREDEEKKTGNLIKIAKTRINRGLILNLRVADNRELNRYIDENPSIRVVFSTKPEEGFQDFIILPRSTYEKMVRNFETIKRLMEAHK